MTEETKTVALARARNLLNAILPKDIPDDFLVVGFAGAFKAAAGNDNMAGLAAIAAALEICRRFGDGKVFIEEDKSDTQTITE